MMPAIEEAAVLNAAAAEAMARVGVHACTDVSGFGLAGHLSEMLDASKAAAVVHLAARAAPRRRPRPHRAATCTPAACATTASTCCRVSTRWARPARRSTSRTARRARPAAGRFAGPVTQQEPLVLALFDPQTSGGLLLAVAPEKHALLLDALEHAGAGAWTVGEVVAGPDRRARARGLSHARRPQQHHPVGRDRRVDPDALTPEDEERRRRPRRSLRRHRPPRALRRPVPAPGRARAHRHRQLGAHHPVRRRLRRAHLGAVAGPLRRVSCVWQLAPRGAHRRSCPLLVTLGGVVGDGARLPRGLGPAVLDDRPGDLGPHRRRAGLRATGRGRTGWSDVGLSAHRLVVRASAW